MDTTHIYTLAAAVSGLTGVIGFFFGRRQNQASAQSTELDNVDKTVKIYQDMLDDVENRFALMEKRHTQEIKELNSYIQNLKHQLAQHQNKPTIE